MRFASILTGGSYRPAIVDGGDLIFLPDRYPDLVAFIEAGEEGMRQARALAGAAGSERVPLAGRVLGPPITRFRRDVLCTGWNYWDHFEESRGKREGQDVDRPSAPTFFTKAPGVVIGPNDPIAFDARISKKWDYEAEVAVIIGRGGRSIPEGRAGEHIFGYCLANDISQRDLQRRHGGQWLKGKSIDATMPLGPFIVTPDELDIPEVRLQCVLNGAVLQDALVKQMAFPIPALIAELSLGMSLYPGDVLLTGTPSGIGNAREPQIFLTEGDEVVVRAEGLGELSNRLASVDLFGDSDVSLEAVPQS
jgi:2,4-didehydro-3-deoxy-L-rhamnonate hydrolase